LKLLDKKFILGPLQNSDSDGEVGSPKDLEKYFVDN